VLDIETGSSLRARFRGGMLWNTIAAVAAQGSTFLASIFVANFLGRDGFGEFNMVYTTAVTAAGIAQFATGMTATKYIAELRDIERERAGRVLALCSLLSLAGGTIATISIASSASWLAAHILKAPHIGSELAVASGFVLFSAANGFQQGALAGLEEYRRLARVAIASGAIHIVGVVFATYWWGLAGAISAVVVSAAARWLLFNAALRGEAERRGIEIRFRDAFRERKIVYRFALPAAIAGLSLMPAVWLSNVFLAQQPGGYGQVGLFGAANNIRNLVLFLPALTNNVGQALLSNQRGHRNQTRYEKVFWANAAVTAGLLLVASGMVAIIGKPLLSFFGAAFVDAYPALLVLLLAAILDGMTVAIYQVVQTQERMWLSLLGIGLPRDLMLVGSAYLLSTKYGAVGLAMAFAVSAIVGFFATTFVAARIGLRVTGLARSSRDSVR
jgi:O-antigen/teichoic acid export membrane protein